MDSGEKFKNDELIRLMKWITSHETEWKQICGDKVITPDEYEKCLRMLCEEKLYEAILILIVCNQATVSTGEFIETTGLKNLAETWNESGREKFIEFIKGKIKTIKE